LVNTICIGLFTNNLKNNNKKKNGEGKKEADLEGEFIFAF